jgi:hypothetical protein
VSDVTFQAKRVENTGAMFLCQSWIEGEGDGVKFDLVCGAGLGSPLLRLTVTKGDQRVAELVDIRDGLTAWVNRLVAEMEPVASEEPHRHEPSIKGLPGSDCKVCGQGFLAGIHQPVPVAPSVELHVYANEDDDDWTVTGDLRETDDDEANYECADDLRTIDVEFDSEHSQLFAYASTKEEADELVLAIQRWVAKRRAS